MFSQIKNNGANSTNGSINSVYETIIYAKSNSPFYQYHFRSFNIDVASFSEQVLKTLPFTTKEDISSNNIDFLAVPKNQVAEYCTTSGTSGDPITIYLTKSDLFTLGKNEARSFRLTGASTEDVFQLMTTIDKQFMAGLAYYLGVQELGAGLIRIGPGVPSMQWKSIFLNKPSVLIAVPGFIVSLIDYAIKNNIDYKSSSVRSIICIGEPIREEDFSLNLLGKRIVDNWEVQLYSTYASTEMGSAFTECEEQNGCHLNTDLLYLEVLKENGEEAKNGEVGEIVITTLQRTGTPLVRYRTGDIAHVYLNNCKCGEPSRRLGPIIGRKSQIIKYKGTTIFPNSIFKIFDSFEEVGCYKVEVSNDSLGNHNITVLLEKEIEESGKIYKIIESCRSQMRVVPDFLFLEKDYLYSQVFKSNIRKPEKIIFK
jgi:phenylacetate-CoA ligase